MEEAATRLISLNQIDEEMDLTGSLLVLLEIAELGTITSLTKLSASAIAENFECGQIQEMAALCRAIEDKQHRDAERKSKADQIR